MKKILIVLLLILLLSGCNTTQTSKVTVDSLQAARSREELAKALNCDINDLKNIISNLNILYEELPTKVDTGENKDIEFKEYRDEEGHLCMTFDQFKSYLTVVDLTTENWKEYFDVVEEHYEEKNAFGEIEYTNDNIRLKLKDNCYQADDNKVLVRVVDQTNDMSFDIEAKYSNDLFLAKRDDGSLYYTYYSEPSFAEQEADFDLNNFIAEKATGTVIVSNIPSEYIFTDDDDYNEACFYIYDAKSNHSFICYSSDISYKYNKDSFFE